MAACAVAVVGETRHQTATRYACALSVRRTGGPAGYFDNTLLSRLSGGSFPNKYGKSGLVMNVRTCRTYNSPALPRTGKKVVT